MSKLLYVHFFINFDVKSLIFSLMFNNYNDFSFEIRYIKTTSTDFVIVIYICKTYYSSFNMENYC